MNITFLRHAKTNLNGKGFIATQLDYPLNESGKNQCKSCLFEEGSFDNVYCSPFKSTIETAKLIYPYKSPIITKDITQRDLGILNEKFKKDYDNNYLKLVREYIINPENAETLEQILERLDNFFAELLIAQNRDDNILVVTHNGIMRIIKKFYMDQDKEIETKNLGSFTFSI